MAKNAVTHTPQTAVPAHLQAFAEELGTNITERGTTPSLSYGGKVWTISLNGEKTKLVKRNEDGDEEPRQIMRVVILDFAKRRGRTYYEGSYDPDKVGAPICWSDDGLEPHASVAEPQCKTCAACPMSAKGSKVTDNGKAVKACSEHRMLAVVPAGQLDFTPLRLKLAITSDWDKQSPDMEASNWFAFSNYTDNLKVRGVAHTAMMVTKMKFDPTADYPKVMFSPDRYLDEEESATVLPLVKSAEVASLISGSWTPEGADGKVVAPPVKEKPKALPAKAAPVVAKAKPADDLDEDVPVDVKPVKAAAAPKVTAKKPVDDEEDEVIPVAKAAKIAKAVAADDDDEPPKKASAKTTAEVPDDVKDLLAEWGDD